MDPSLNVGQGLGEPLVLVLEEKPGQGVVLRVPIDEQENDLQGGLEIKPGVEVAEACRPDPEGALWFKNDKRRFCVIVLEEIFSAS